MGWKVMNTGTSAWDPKRVEFTYFGGAKLYDYAVVHLEESVAPAETVVLSVHMKAPPRKSTRYTTYWSLRQGDIFFCRVRVSLYVK